MSVPFCTPAHHLLREEVRDFSETVIRPQVEALEARRAVESDIPRQIARRGWIGVTVPKEFGGMGAGHVAKTVVLEEISRVSAAMGAAAQASQLGTAKILHFGSAEQQQRWLPSVADGSCLPTIAVTELASGSHVLAMKGTATAAGDDYVLNGAKDWVGNSHIGDLHGVVLRTGEGSKGLSAFLVEATRPGVELGPYRPAFGLPGFSFGQVSMTECHVPSSNRLGSEGDGLAVAYSSSVLYGRTCLAAVALGIHRAILEDTVAFTGARRLYGKSLSRESSIVQQVGRMQSNLQSAELALYYACHRLDEGATCDGDLYNAKLVNVELARDSARRAMEIHGAHGLIPEHRVSRYLRDIEHISAPAGTSAVQRIRLAELARGENGHQWSAQFIAGAAA